jgi:ATP-dependent DNA helicase RecG
MQKRRRALLAEKALPVSVNRKSLNDFVESFPFPATAAQMNAIETIVSDFEKPHPMLRLLEGDVGSGKTAVAAATAYLVATSLPAGRIAGTLQVAYLCPTEVLAKQHFSTFISYFRDHPIPIGLITGNECRKFPSRVRYEESAKLSKPAFKKMVANGEIPIVIGTHALIEKSLSFKYLAYAIIDEQHRFGTMHRQKLVTKDSIAPHLLSMTATPIPRTLALTLYGDLDLTLLDEMPVGRKSVITEILNPEKRERAYERVRSELAKNHQTYVICPRIDEPDPARELALIAKSVKAEAARLKKEIFPDTTIGILHSKMTPIEKETAMKKFENGETDILVATSVVEVGVNVPNATVILIEGAERFGLAQLHQLRGRVIRSTHQSYCFALPESSGETTRGRMKAFISAKNGFELAEYDLSLRGAGELAGGKQWGVSDIAMEALKNIKLVEAARAEATQLVAVDPELKNHPALSFRARAAGAEVHLE